MNKLSVVLCHLCSVECFHISLVVQPTPLCLKFIEMATDTGIILKGSMRRNYLDLF
jgi:hypothetical protein